MESKATYDKIKKYVFENTGLMVSNLYIAQTKKKSGLEWARNFNLSKIGEITDTKAQDFIEQETQKDGAESTQSDDTAVDKNVVVNEKEDSEEEESEEETDEEDIKDDTTDSKIPGGLIFGVLGVLVIAIIGFVIFSKSKGSKKKAE